jgi:hypothetical protein
MSNSKWMLHHFRPLIVHSDGESAPEWYRQLAEERFDPDIENYSFIALCAAIKFGGLSPLHPLLRGDFVGSGHNAALCFSTDGIYPTIPGDRRKESIHQHFAVAVLKPELITAGARESLHKVISNEYTKRAPDNLFDFDSDSITQFIESEARSFASCRPRPEPSENTHRSQMLYWQPTSAEIAYSIESNNRYWSPSYRLRLPGIRLFGPEDDNCHLSKVYIIVDDREYAETIQELITDLFHSILNSFSTEFSRQRLLDTNIIITDELRTDSSRSLPIEIIEQIYPAGIVNAVDI